MKPICSLLFVMFALVSSFAQQKTFDSDVRSENKPWTNKEFKNDPNEFQFAIVSDRTGGHREGIFGQAINRLNLLVPEFVMSVGDLIEGYTEDQNIIHKQWVEFDSLLDPLSMRFFALPGNHDISNDVMREKWLDRYGRAYYYFIYKNVLFLALDSNDYDGDGHISTEQIDYFKKVLAKNKDVKWTMVFMHHPVWLYDNFVGFKDLEAQLKKRPYTVFAGHNHQYFHDQRQQQNYYVLSTTGGGSRMRGAHFGEFDHVTWVTMTKNGPKTLNLDLKGMLKHDVANKATIEKKNALINASQFNSLLTLNKDKSKGSYHLAIENQGNDTIYFEGRLYHHHQLNFKNNTLSMKIPPKQSTSSILNWERTTDLPLEEIDPVELDFRIGYKITKIDLPFELTGTYLFSNTINPTAIQMTKPYIFTDKKDIELTSIFDKLALKYTTNGEEPNLGSKTYNSPISTSNNMTLKVALFDAQLGYKSPVLTEDYRKVTPIASVKNASAHNKGLHYTYYEGDFTTIPKFEKLNVNHTGTALDFDVEAIADLKQRKDKFALEYTGLIDVPEDGIYTFYTTSDDGSMLYIHDQLVVDNNGSHSKRTRQGHIALKKGKHPIKISYFEDYSSEVLRVLWQLPSQQKIEPIPFKHLSH